MLEIYALIENTKGESKLKKHRYFPIKKRYLKMKVNESNNEVKVFNFKGI